MYRRMNAGALCPPVRPITTMARANLNSWLHSPRTLIMALFVLALCYMQAAGFAMTLERLPYTMNWAESSVYVLSNGVNMSVSGILYLVMISELPQKTAFQTASLVRSTRMRWLVGQICYCFMMAFVMLLIVAVCVSIFLLPVAPQGTGWTETQAIAQGYTNEDMVLIPEFIRTNLEPFTAYLLACVPLLLFWFTMALVVLLCSLFGAPILGILLFVFLLMANIIVYVEFFPSLMVPVQFATLRAILFLERNAGWALLGKVLIGYLAIDAALIGAMLWRVRRTDLCY